MTAQCAEVESKGNAVVEQLSEMNNIFIEQYESVKVTVSTELGTFSEHITNDVKNTKAQMKAENEKTVEEVSQKIDSMQAYTQMNIADMTMQCAEVESKGNVVVQQLSEMNNSFAEQYESVKATVSTELETFSEHITNAEKDFSNLIENFNTVKEELRIFRENQQKNIKKVMTLGSIVTVVLVISIGYLFIK